MKSILIYAAILSLFGCVSADWVSQENYPDRGGVVRYLNAGADSVIASRRSDAYTKISSYCGDTYTILKESHDSEKNSSFIMDAPGGFAVLNETSRYLHLHFVCKSEEEIAEERKPRNSPVVDEVIAPEDKKIVFKKAKMCQEKGGVWINSTCQIQIDDSSENINQAQTVQKKPVEKKVINLDQLINLAKSGDVDAQYELGYKYSIGDGVPINNEKAIFWFKKAAENGHKMAKIRVREHSNGVGH